MASADRSHRSLVDEAHRLAGARVRPDLRTGNPGDGERLHDPVAHLAREPGADLVDARADRGGGAGPVGGFAGDPEHELILGLMTPQHYLEPFDQLARGRGIDDRPQVIEVQGHVPDPRTLVRAAEQAERA